MRRQLSALLWRVLAPTLEVVREEGREEVRAELDQAEARIKAVRDELALWDAAPAGQVMPVNGAAYLMRRALDGEQ